MRSIPAVMKAKLEQHLKAESNDSMQNLRIIATQITSNTLLTEPIHEDIKADYGDVALRQIAGEKDISKAYAICLDNEVAQIYQREFPANMEQPWDYLWTIGAATDVGIEFQGTWELNAEREWYYLQTEELPYIFWINKGDLYVQKWNDTSTKITLDTGVSQLSVCKGWKSNDFPDLDQGLIVGYIKSGRVFYRAYCSQADGTNLWEPSYEVINLGEGNTYLSVIRTNDFRIGFISEKNGTMHWTLSSRNYAGMSFRPETVHIEALKPKVILEKIRVQEPKVIETTKIETQYVYALLEPLSVEPLSIIAVEKINKDTGFMCNGFKLFFNKQLYGIIDDDFLFGVKLSTSTKIASAAYDPSEKTIVFMTQTDILRTIEVTITINEYRPMYYESFGNQKHPLTSLTAVAEAETNDIFAEVNENVVLISGASVQIELETITCKYGEHPLETVSITALSCTVELVPISNLPI